MLQFIVLGLVPGTHLQITIMWFVILGMAIDIAFGLLYFYSVYSSKDPLVNKNTNQVVSKKLSA